MCLSVRLSVLLLLRLRLLPLLLQLMLLLLLLWFRVMMISPALTHLKSQSGKKRSQNVQSGPTNQGRVGTQACAFNQERARAHPSEPKRARAPLARLETMAGCRAHGPPQMMMVRVQSTGRPTSRPPRLLDLGRASASAPARKRRSAVAATQPGRGRRKRGGRFLAPSPSPSRLSTIRGYTYGRSFEEQKFLQEKEHFSSLWLVDRKKCISCGGTHTDAYSETGLPLALGPGNTRRSCMNGLRAAALEWVRVPRCARKRSVCAISAVLRAVSGTGRRRRRRRRCEV